MEKISVAFLFACLLGAFSAKAQQDTLALKADQTVVEEEKKKVFEIYGFIMMDAGYNFNQIHPDWYDVVRPTKLPSYKNEYGTDGNVYFSVRQTRLGFKGYIPTPKGELKTIFEFELFGTGADAGQTTFRLRHAYAEFGHFGFGQYWSPFMDIDVFPNTVEYWGPTGMVFFRNIQFRYMPLMGDKHKMSIALERPGASADQGEYSGRIELAGVKSRFLFPDVSAEYRYTGKHGYVELAGIMRPIKWEDQNADTIDLSGHAIGWGLNLSSNINIGKKVVTRLQLVYGQGIQNYMNDAPVDVAIENNFDDPEQPIKGVAVPIIGAVAFVDVNWSEKFSSSVGYSVSHNWNTDGQSPDAFKRGHYAIANLMCYPFKGGMMGIEGQFGTRENYSDGWNTEIWKIQFSAKYNFAHAFYKKTKN